MADHNPARTGLNMMFAAVLSGCGELQERKALSGSHLKAAQVSGYGDIRSWGDEVTPTIEAVISQQ